MVSAKNGRFPKDMKPMGRFYNITFNPANGEHSLMVTTPTPGHWFMFAYASRRREPSFYGLLNDVVTDQVRYA